jgi:hypothetical protein
MSAEAFFVYSLTEIMEPQVQSRHALQAYTMLELNMTATVLAPHGGLGREVLEAIDSSIKLLCCDVYFLL